MLSGVAHGAGLLFAGLRMWRRRPGLMLLGVLPALISLVLLAAAVVLLVLFADELIGWATPFADGWPSLWRHVLRVGLYVAVVLGSLFLSVVTYTALTLAIGDPFYERIWRETELMLGGVAPDRGIGWWRAIADAIVLALLGLVATVVVFLIGLVPVVGAVVGPVLGIAVSGRLLAGELVSRALEARGMDRAARRRVLGPQGPALLGFGVAVQVCFLVPFGAVLMMPAAVVGSTMLAREALDAA